MELNRFDERRYRIYFSNNNKSTYVLSDGHERNKLPCYIRHRLALSFAFLFANCNSIVLGIFHSNWLAMSVIPFYALSREIVQVRSRIHDGNWRLISMNDETAKKLNCFNSLLYALTCPDLFRTKPATFSTASYFSKRSHAPACTETNSLIKWKISISAGRCALYV